MISPEMAIRRTRRDLTMAAALKFGLIGAAAVCLLAGPLLDPGGHLTFGLILIGVLWMVLTYRSARGSSLAAGSQLLIDAGQYEQAEEQIEAALRSFSLFRAVKLLSLHNLALLRHAQKRWSETVQLCRALQGQRLGAMQGLSRSSRLILAESLLELNDLPGAYGVMQGLYHQRLSLSEAMQLMNVQLDYEARLGAWQAMLAGWMNKVQMAELMPSAAAAKVQACLALAARKSGQAELADWLWSRVRLLADSELLVAQWPWLKDAEALYL